MERYMRIKGSSQHDFATIPQALIPRSAFDRSHNIKTTINAGLLIPFLVDEILPGDTFKVKATMFARFATLLFPLFDNMYLETFYFFVPNRLVWDNWQKFNGEQENPGDSTSFVVPKIASPAAGYGEGTIFDYMGLPTKVTSSFDHIALPLRGYSLIWNQWFRDENLQNSLTVSTGDGPDLYTAYALQRRGKRRDYFTSGLPWPQKGTAVTLPLGSSAPVKGTGAVRMATGGIAGAISPFYRQNVANGPWISGSTGDGAQYYWPDGTTNSTNLVADLSTATAATINQLRQAFQIQRMYERDARGGTRYTEILRSHFGVISPDQRLQRPEFLGHGSTIVNITPIAQTAPASGGSTPLANLAGIGTAAVLNHGFTKSFVEHGFIFGLMCVRADLNYMQGLQRFWSRQTRFDYYWPALSHLGEQAILNKEIYTQGTSADANVFAYQEAFAEYRYFPSLITSLFRSNATGTLDSWHLAQDFSSLPALNSAFIVENPPTTRVKANTSDPDFIIDGRIDMHCVRPMPVYSVPGLIDHF